MWPKLSRWTVCIPAALILYLMFRRCRGATTPQDGLKAPKDRLVVLECCDGNTIITPRRVTIERGGTIWFTLTNAESAEVDMLARSDLDDVVIDLEKRKTVGRNCGRVLVGFTVKPNAPIGEREYDVTIEDCERTETRALMARRSPVMDIRE